MTTVPFFSWFGKSCIAKASVFLLMCSVTPSGLVLGQSSEFEAASTIQTSPDISTDIPRIVEHSQRLDQELADVESRIQILKGQQSPDALILHPQSVERAPLQVVLQMGAADMKEPEVQRLEETLVKDTYLDPFNDDVNTEIIKDPWEPMNEHVFSFNLHVDRYVLKPVATGYAWLLPDPVEQAIGRAMTNIRFVPRTVNNLLQWKLENAGIEVGRFVVNSTVGVVGLFDIAGDYLDLPPVPAEDFGQTLARHGVQAGPYLVLPLLPPTTVRDGIGTVGDVLLDPLSYVLPFIPQASMRATEIVNERSKNLDLYEGVEVATLDMYGAVREAYAQKRSKVIRE
ncbi:MAG: VacJ family lipoprotein [Nitrospirae bacterium]|nr:VacJ family lipoprotein [Nitrospirota bacterium]MDA1305553.1 VacJ family lipoprotein [Nitrospirota bacterium]